MNPRLLTLALHTPLEQLLELPNAVRIAVWAKEELARFNDDQLLELLAWIDAVIQLTVMREQSGSGGDVVERSDERDLDWLMCAIENHKTYSLRSGTTFGWRDCYRVLALHKLGAVINAVSGLSAGVLTVPLTATLMESLEAILLANTLPDVESTEVIVERAWREGMTPPPPVVDVEIAKAVSRTSRTLNDVLHAPNREAKRKGIDLYFSNTYATDELAYRVIGAQVCRSPGTVRNWILEEKKRRKRSP